MKNMYTQEFTNMTIAGKSTRNEDIFPIENGDLPGIFQPAM